MFRPRDLTKWKPVTQHSDIGAFLKTKITTGLHAVDLRHQYFDLLVEDRGAPLTIVFFHGAATTRTRTYPILQGGGVAERSNANLIAIADPTIQLGNLDLAWYIGNAHTGPLKPLLSPLIKHALECLASSRVLFVGASGGGYAAINFAADFADSLVLAINPRLHLNRKPFPGVRMVEYLKAAYRVKTNNGLREARRQHVIDDVAELIPKKLNFNLCLYQNLGDYWYLTRQAEPFIERFKSDPKLHVRFDNYGKGHRPIPSTVLDEIIHSFIAEPDLQNAITSAGFKPTSSLFQRSKDFSRRSSFTQ